MFKRVGLTLFLGAVFLSPLSVLAAGDTLKGSIQWDEQKAREIALRHLERQIDVHFFKTKDERYFERLKARLGDPNLKMAHQQVTWFENDEYSVAYEGENMVHYYRQDATLFKVSVCNQPFGDEWRYPRRCIEYSVPGGDFLTVSMDVSPEESYVFDLQGNLLQHWKDDQGFSAQGGSNWVRWTDTESNRSQRQPASSPTERD